MTDEYRDNLRDGNEFQDYVTIQLLRYGIIVNQFTSKKYQDEYGESSSGIEIKYDRKFRETGNFYIEYQEKSNKNNPNYVDSGILRKDNTWLWVIGDYDDLYIISKRTMQYLYAWTCVHKDAAAKNGIKFAMKETSKGMLIPVSLMAERYTLKHISVKHGVVKNE